MNTASLKTNQFHSDANPHYIHRAVVPDLPNPSTYAHLLQEIHDNGWYSNFGPLVRRFEQNLLSTYGVTAETAVTACNATAGISAALLASGRSGPVLVPAFTFPASLGAVRAVGMTPVMVDVAPATWTMDPTQLANALARTGATSVMLVAPFGIRQDFTAEIELCRRHRATVVIDNAAGLGVPRIHATADDHLFEVFSMHATKPFGVGEGGVVFSHRDQDAPLRAALGFALTSHDKPEGPHWGFNGKMSEFHAAVGLVQLERFGDLIRARQDFVVAYQRHLARWPALEFPNDATRAPWQCFPVLFPTRASAERFVSAAARAGVEIRRYYRPSLSRWPGTACFGPCPVAEELADRMCVLPVRSLPHGAARDEVIGAVLAVLEEACSEI